MNHCDKVLAVIPARSGSKRLPNKNTRSFAGKPLLNWAIESALESKGVDEVLVSSDSDEILALALKYKGVTVHKRSEAASSDQASSFDFLSEILVNYPENYAVALLQPTSPLRMCSDIENALALHLDSHKPVVSVVRNQISPYWSFKLGADGELNSLFPDALNKRSQDLSQTYSLNGAIYIDSSAHYLAEKTFLSRGTLPYVMSEESSIDIDTLEEFDKAESEMHRRMALGL
jgi:CMP-N-acetylneuraminic acid synthetase